MADALKDGFIWQVGDGNTIDIQWDHWGIEENYLETQNASQDQVFSWRIGHDILPTYINIARIRQNFSTTCPRCKNSDETLLHTLKECSKNYWNNRSKMVFQGKDDPAMVVWDRAQTLSKDFRIFNLNEPSMIPPTPVCKGWKKPLNDFIKINVYAVVLNGYVGYGDITRDTNGFVLAGCYGFAIKACNLGEVGSVDYGFESGFNFNKHGQKT
ncbi:uncharacterized protein [Gossypium hirsutum]|uniref:Reverse transcriptase zinc-binding domain-containing protein n=1 Tax=Gossypium hirsutum TaxID=3635 RepID=A0A1U8NQC0_GOSHI|nr:uncharacterized protein LOC107949913 [Gossypium hirsutum]